LNNLFLIVGPSGSGKTTVMRSVMKNEIVSCTTREQREGEVNGVDYVFVTEDEFKSAFDDGLLIEHTKYSGNYYGLSYHEIESKLKKDHAFAIVDINGLQQLKAIYPYCTSIFIKTTKEHCTRAMIERGDSLIKVHQRLETFEDEQYDALENCDYVVKNEYGDISKAICVITSIIEVHTV
jgi:guanylate kinase